MGGGQRKKKKQKTMGRCSYARRQNPSLGQIKPGKVEGDRGGDATRAQKEKGGGKQIPSGQAKKKRKKVGHPQGKQQAHGGVE